MQSSHKSEILFLYISYFVTLAFGLLPSISYIALGLLSFQAFYALVRYMNASENVYKSHLFNYLLALGVSFALYLILYIQAAAVGFEIIKAVYSQSKFESANSAGYIFLMMIIESLIAVFWPIVLIVRGLFLVGTDRVVFAGFNKRSGAMSSSQDANMFKTAKVNTGGSMQWQLSGVLPNGNIIREVIDLHQGPYVIGRDRVDARIVVQDDSVSRRHAEILNRNGSFAIRDLGSTNGTKLRGRDIGYNVEALYPSDEILIGSIKLNVSVC